jgi:hypothetical protein
MNITFEILGNSFYSGTRIELIDFEDLWFMFHWKWLDMNLLVVFCLQVNSNSFNFLNASLVFFYPNTFSSYDILLRRMQFMDFVKLDGRSTIRILDLTHVSQTSHNVILKKESEMYKNMTMTTFNKEVCHMRKEAWSWVALYIAKATHAFVEGGTKTLLIPYFLK